MKNKITIEEYLAKKGYEITEACEYSLTINSENHMCRYCVDYPVDRMLEDFA